MAEKLTMADIAELAGVTKVQYPGILTGEASKKRREKDPECGERE